MEDFPARSVVNTYMRTESMLVDILRVIPYCSEHEHVWSDELSPVIIESCSLLDSLWKAQSKKSPCVKEDRLTMLHYFTFFGERLVPQWVVFWGEMGMKITPFDGWSKTHIYKTKDDYSELDWWAAYNNLKHDRLGYRKEARLHICIKAVAALFLAILRCEYCKEAIEQVGWLSGQGRNLKVHLGEDSKTTRWEYVAAESKLFSHPIGWCTAEIFKGIVWEGPSSLRFKDWFDKYIEHNSSI